MQERQNFDCQNKHELQKFTLLNPLFTPSHTIAGLIKIVLCGDQMRTLFYRCWPITYIFVLIEHQAIRASLMVLNFTLAHKVLFTNLRVTMERNLTLVVFTEFLFLLRFRARNDCFIWSFIIPFYVISF